MLAGTPAKSRAGGAVLVLGANSSFSNTIIDYLWGWGRGGVQNKFIHASGY